MGGMMALIAFNMLASESDMRTGKIPNNIVVLGIIVGLCSTTTLEGSLLGLLFICAMGVFFDFAGKGDIKLLAMNCAFMGFLQSAFAFSISAVLFIIVKLITDSSARQVAIISKNEYMMNKKIPYIVDQKGYPFAPYMLMGVVIFEIIINI